MKAGKIITILCLFLFLKEGMSAQSMTLTLNETISLAADSSLEAFRSKHLYLAGYWQYRNYKAERLPSLTLDLTPVEYSQRITRNYNSEQDIYVYSELHYYYARGGLRMTQNFDLLGGGFYLASDLDYIRNFGDNTSTQFTSVPIRIGYSQDLIGYNPFRWERKLEPLKYEKAKNELLYNLEQVNENASAYFFDLAMAQAEYDLAKENVASTDTLYLTGQERHRIAAITQADLLTLRLDAVNAKNTLQNKEIEFKRAMFNLASFLNFDKNTEIRLRLPGRPHNLNISVDNAISYARENNPKYLGLQQQILEAEQQVDRTKKEALFNASFSASVGFNQVANQFNDVYRNLMPQDVVAISLSIPLIDWGVRKGRYNIARNNLNVTQISVQQEELTVEEDIIMTVSDFNVQQD